MIINRRLFLASGCLSLLGAAAMGPRPALAGQQQRISVTAGGDCIIMRPLSILKDESFLKVAELFRNSDVGFGNCETTMHDYAGYPAPSGICGDLNLRTDPAIAREISWFGINLMSMANNHAGDYGAEGLMETLSHLKSAGITTAGAGSNLFLARSPGFREVAHGRVALISCASTFRTGSQAGPAYAAIQGRPGINPLKVYRVNRIRAEHMAMLRSIRDELQSTAFQWPDEVKPDSHPDRIYFTGDIFETADRPEVGIEADDQDLKEIIHNIERARVEADIVVVSIHAHEAGQRREDPPEFLKRFARCCVDAGADLFIGHGPLSLRGMEIYKGKPIFYSVGSLFFQPESMEQIPAEIYQACGVNDYSPSNFFHKVMGDMLEEAPYWESIVPQVKFENGKCVSISLYPVDLGWKLPHNVRGTPRLASAMKAQEILERFAQLSQPFGTNIQVSGANAMVRL